MTDFAANVAAQLSLHLPKVAATIELLDAGNTIPFIARYRKERTGGLDEAQLRAIDAELERIRALEERRDTIIGAIAEQGKLTPELRERLLAAATRTELEDLYQPYRAKRRTRASVARERGLEELAELVLEQPRTARRPDELAQAFVNAEVPTADDAWAGARDIVAERIADHADVRRLCRERAMQSGALQADRVPKSEDPRSVFQTYYEWGQRIERIKPYQVLALNRGETEGVLRVRVAVRERDWQAAIAAAFRPDRRSPLFGQLQLAIADAAERLLLPAIERDVRRELSERAGAHAIAVFAANLRQLLSQPPLAGHIVGGIDPGFRTGCKIAVVDATGRLLETATIFPYPPQNQREAARRVLANLGRQHGITLWAIGNGTASRETEQLVAESIRGASAARYLIVNEAGASVYSASPLARAELPGLDVSMRGAVSIARRVQDPLAELSFARF